MKTRRSGIQVWQSAAKRTGYTPDGASQGDEVASAISILQILV